MREDTPQPTDAWSNVF